jgi:hypothetical protein
VKELVRLSSIMMLTVWTLSGAMSAGCLSEAIDVEGKRCATDRPCGLGILCIEGRCTTDAGNRGPNDAGSRGPNLLVNGTFESGSQPEGWSSLTGVPLLIETLSVHDGARALTVGLGADGVVPTVAPVSSSQADTLYCASAFVWGTGAQVVLSILEGDSASPSTRFESPALTSSGKWSEIRAEGRAHGGSPLTVQLRAITTLGTFLVDDIELCISTGSSCD